MNPMRLDDVGPGLEHVSGVNPMDAREVAGHMAGDGFARPEYNRTTSSHRRRVREAARLMVNAINGVEDPFIFRQAFKPTSEIYVRHLQEKYPGLFPAGTIGLRETMSYSDYSALTVDVLDRILYGYYNASPIANMPLVKVHPLRDFRVVARYEMDGATTPWSAVVPQTGTAQAFPSVPHGPGEPPTERSMAQAALEVLGSTQRVTYQPQLYQGKMSVNWRALVNDDLGIFSDMTNRLAIGGRRTLYAYITSLYSSTTGPNTALFNSTFGNIVNAANGAPSGKNNPSLDFQGLIDAITVLMLQKDIDGQPIDFTGQLYLVVGPGLRTTADALTQSNFADISVGGGTTNTQGFPSQRLNVPTQYVLRGMQVIEDKYLPIITTSAGTKSTQWYLFYDPNTQARPAIELGMLKGFESPQMFQKAPNTMRAGGGVDPMMGDWNTMDQEFKGILVFGGTQIDGRSCVASTGQNV